MDLDESLRAIYFAPVPLVVLDNNRQIRMLNRPAESLLATTAQSCVGQPLGSWVIPAYRQIYTQALVDAAQSGKARNWSLPIYTRLTFMEGINENGEGASGHVFGAEVSVSAWFPTDQMFGGNVGTPFETSDIFLGGALSPSSAGMELSPQTTPTFETHRNLDSAVKQQQNSRMQFQPLHEAYYTLSLTPVQTRERRMSPSDAKLSAADTLRDSLFHTLDTPLMALSKDGTTLLRNKACDGVLKWFAKKNPTGEAAAPSTKPDTGDEKALIDLSWLTDTMSCWTEDFSEVFPNHKFPIYRCAVLGERPPIVNVGCIASDSGVRRVFRVEGQPVRDAGGFGEHVGGVIQLRDVTDEIQSQKDLIKKEGESYFKLICESLAQLVWVTDPVGYHEWYNQQWYDYTGTTEEQCLGVGWSGIFHPDDMPETSKRWSHSLRTGELYSTEYRCRRKDGTFRWMLGRALPVRDPETGTIVKWFGTCTDIHDTVEALAASRQSQDRLENVINHAAMTLWAVDVNGIITVAEGPGVRQLKLLGPGTPGSSSDDSGSGSSQSRRSFLMQPSQDPLSASGDDGQNEDVLMSGARSPSITNSQTTASRSKASTKKQNRSMIGKSIYSVWGDAPRLYIEKALAGESCVEESEIEGRWFRTQYSPIRNEEHSEGRDGAKDAPIIGVVGASMDVTDRRRAQEQTEQSLKEKARAKAAETAAKEASRLKSEFLANMSHEIRTPIAGVIGLSELLLDTKGLTPEGRELTENIQRSADALLTVINDVLDFSKVEIGKLDIEKTPFSLNLVCRDTIKMLSFATSKKGLAFAEQCDLRHQGLLLGDAGRVRQVLTNLLTNAIKFTEKGSISLVVKETAEDAENITVHFDVEDTGCGISKKVLSKLFQPFSQADPSTARKFGGTGLGLTICKNLVELMHGKIGLESEDGKGSRAWFEIPFAKARDSSLTLDIKNDSTPASSALGVSSDPLRRSKGDVWILVAEDNLINAQIALKTLKKIGFNARTAENGNLALEELRNRPYDLVLMDCMMPECDGYEATTRLRRSDDAEVRALPVIALTASAIKGDRERALAAGMNDYLSKPVKRPALEAMLTKWLFDQNTRQALSQYLVPLSPSTRSSRSSFDLSDDGGQTQHVMAAAMHAAVEAQRSASSTGSAGRRDFTALDPLAQALEEGQSEGVEAVPRITHAAEQALDQGDVDSLMREAHAIAASDPTTTTSVSDPNGLVAALERSGPANTAALAAALHPAATPRSSTKELELVDTAPVPNDGWAHVTERVRAGQAGSKRPTPPARGQSYGSTFSISSEGETPTSTKTPTLPPRRPAAMIRRSSRTQAGMGRDLDSEVMRAVEGQPSLPNLITPPDEASEAQVVEQQQQAAEEMEQSEDGNITQ